MANIAPADVRSVVRFRAVIAAATHVANLLLPALIPSWRFFDVIGPSPRIEYALFDAQDVPVDGEDAQHLGNDLGNDLGNANWRAYRARPQEVSWPTMLGRLWWNAAWNEALFAVSCAERLVDAPTPALEVLMLQRIVGHLDRQDETPRESPHKALAKAAEKTLTAARIAMRIMLVERAGEQIITYAAYTSAVRSIPSLRQPWW